jgi:beta-ribofuranosylaminobenzene 5'-phosphate synthase
VIRVETGSRLHFGLFSLPGANAEHSKWLDGEGQPSIPARNFGGAGLMVKYPGIALTVAPAAAWSAQGPCAGRALNFAKTVCAGLGVQQSFAVNMELCPQEHVGLGTGTQLGLAVARAIAMATDHADSAVTDLAKLVGRGRRSALGIHGFVHGGFLVEAGKPEPDGISPLVAQLQLPDEWSVLLVIPRGLQGDHGQREAEAFQQLERTPQILARTEALCRVVLLGMLPALAERDLESFGNAVYDFNRRVGEMFMPWQGGIYSHPAAAELICGLRNAGVKGVGHSSWGPTVFAIVPCQEAASLGDWLCRKYGLQRADIVVTSAKNAGATTTTTKT